MWAFNGHLQLQINFWALDGIKNCQNPASNSESWGLSFPSVKIGVDMQQFWVPKAKILLPHLETTWGLLIVLTTEPYLIVTRVFLGVYGS